MIALDLLFDVPFGLVGAGLAFTVVAICRLVRSRRRSWMALAVFFSGSFAAWRLLSGREVWPAAWIPFLLTIVGGGASLLPTLRSAGGLWTRASRPVTAASTLLVVAVALAVSYADANRGVPAILMLAGPNPESYFDVAELRIREPPCRIRYVQEDLREEPGRPVVFWTWEQDCPVSWDELSRVPEALFLVEIDPGSGISSTCVRPATDEATRERVEGLIAEWWSRQATLLPPPKPDLRGKAIFRMVRCEYLDRFYEKRKQYASEKGHEFIEVHGPTAVLAFPWKRSKPGNSVEWSGWYSGDTASSVDKVRECLRTNRVAYRTVHADVLLVEAEGAISRFERSDLRASGFLLFRPGEMPRRIACSSAAECATEFSRVAPRYFGHPECSSHPERAAASG